MKNHAKSALTNVLLAIFACLASAALNAQENSPICSASALDVLNKFPKPPESCPEGNDGAPFFDANSVINYQKSIDSLGSDWWQLSLAELNACAVRQEAGPLTQDQQATLEYGQKFTGDAAIRVFSDLDPCSNLSNVFVAVKTASGKSVLTQIAEQKMHYADGPLFDLLGVAPLQNKTVAVLENCDSGPGYRFNCTFFAYQVDFQAGAFNPYPLFHTARGPVALLYSEQCDRETEDEDNDNPQIEIFKGKQWAPRFSLQECDYAAGENGEAKAVKRQFTLHGSEYAIDHYEKDGAALHAQLQKQRECIKQKFAPNQTEPACPGDFSCEKDNDLAYLFFKAGKLEKAKDWADQALSDCKFSTIREQKAARYNHEIIQKALLGDKRH